MSRLSDHGLLDPPAPAYTNVTVRRAFIVWLHCGQANKFKDVCNYFHYLERLEDQLTVEHRAISRHHEFDLFTNPPPSSTYLTSHHPKLYDHTQLENYYFTKVEEIRNEKCVFKLEGFEEIGPKSGATKQEIVDTSQLIRNYCLSHSLTLKKFLQEFKDYAAKSELRNSVQNVAIYIKKQMIKEEITMIANCPKTFSFLEDDYEEVEESVNLNSQRRLLDSIRLSPILSINGADVWSNDDLEHKLLNARQAFANKPEQNQQAINQKSIDQPVKPAREVTTFDVERINMLKQKFQNDLIVL